MLEEERLQAHVYNYGSMYKCAKRFDWPGIDQLCTEPDGLMYPGVIPIARLLASFADVYGDGESFTEFSDHTSRMAGKTAEKSWTYASVNWHIAQGINNFTSYYPFQGWSEAELRALNLYTARCGQTMRRGRRASTVALLYPEASMWNAYTPSVAERAIDHSPHTRRLDDIFARTSWELLSNQVDFDYLDEDAINESEITDGALRYSGREYSCVVLPGADVLGHKAALKLAEAGRAGVGVVCVGNYPEYTREDGEKFDFSALFGSSLALCATGDGFAPVGLLETGLLRPVIGISGSGDRRRVLAHVRADGGALLVFACNMSGEPFDGVLTAPGGSAELADPLTGDVAPVSGEIRGGTLTVPLRLAPNAALIYEFK